MLRHREDGAGEGAYQGEEDLHGAHGADGAKIPCPEPAGQFEVCLHIPGKEVQHKGGGHIEDRGKYRQGDRLGGRGDLLEEPVRQITGDHEDVGDAHAQEILIEPLAVPLIVQGVNHRDEGQNDGEDVQHDIGQHHLVDHVRHAPLQITAHSITPGKKFVDR